MTKYKMMVNWKEYDGAYTVDECGENVKVALNSMPDLYNPSFTFTKVNDDGSAYTIKSTKKSKTQPKSFSDMVQKQRSKNNGIVKFDADTTFVSDKLNEALVPLKEAMESWNDATPEGQRVGAEIMEAVMSIEEVLERIK